MSALVASVMYCRWPGRGLPAMAAAPAVDVEAGVDMCPREISFPPVSLFHGTNSYVAKCLLLDGTRDRMNV
jgi:hypothetical protein